LGVYGAGSAQILNTLKTLRRNGTNDRPLLLFYSPTHEDVCNSYSDTTPYMTTAKRFSTNVIEAMVYLDSILPKGINHKNTKNDFHFYFRKKKKDHMLFSWDYWMDLFGGIH